MLQAIVHWSLHNRGVVVVLAGILLGLGLYAAGHSRLDVFPEFAPPQAVIQTEAPGLSPSEVEQLVTLPLEMAVNGVPRLVVLRSQSLQGLSVLQVVFQDGTDIYRARQQISERLGELAGQLPVGVKPPRLAPLTATTGRLLTVGFTSEKLSLLELRDRVQWQVRPRLLGVPGVAQVTVYGGEQRQFQVRLNPEQLAARNLTLTDVLDAARQASAIRGAGYLENDRQRVLIRSEGQVRSAAQLGDTVVARSEGTPVRLGDVAEVVEAAAPRFGDALINGQPGVVLVIFRQIDADTPGVTALVETELDRLQAYLQRQDIAYHPALFRQASFIEHAVGNVAWSLLIGAILVTLVLFLFLFNLRTAVISLTAIPLSLLGAILVLWGFGIGLNTLTLGGLAIAVGEVVDDAIIDVENIFRRLNEWREAADAPLAPRPSPLEVVLQASLEVRGAVVYATFIVVLVFVPVFFLSGLQGRLFVPLGYAFVLAVLASLAVALTVTPALCLLFLPGTSGAVEPPLLRRLQAGYEGLLRRLDGDFPLLLTGSILLLLAAIAASTTFGGQFLPELRENHFVVHMRALPGTSLPESLATGKQVTHALRKHPSVLCVTQLAGRAELAEDAWGVEYSEIEVDLRRLGAEDIEQTQRELAQILGQFPGCNFELYPFLTERIMETLSGTPAAVAVKIFGDDLPALDRAAQDIHRELLTIPGNENVRIEPQTGGPELVVRIRPEDAARFGLRSAHILEAVHASFQGADVGQVFDRNRNIDVVVILQSPFRADRDSLANLWLSVPPNVDPKDPGTRDAPVKADSLGRIQLKQVADVFLSDGRFLIAHEGGLRRQLVTCNVQGGDVATFVARAEKALAKLPLPEGVYYTFSGEHEAQRSARRELSLLSLAVALGILLLLWLAFRDLRHLLLILINLPFALIGGVAAIYLTGGILDVGALIGFVTLFGITTRNGIMMVSHWQHLHTVQGLPWGPELIFRGARERLAPVLMTALVTGLGLLPIAVGSGEAGREIEGPMALVILGGLVTSTALNLLVLPAVTLRLGKRGE